MKVITIIGAGWLGKPLADYLSSLGHKVYASRTSDVGAKEVSSSSVNGFICDLNDKSDALSQTLTSQNCEILIGCFPPGFRKMGGEAYPSHWKYLCEQAKKAGVKRVVMVSSTTVYPNLAETMTESRATLLLSQQQKQFSDNGKAMLKAEQYVIDSQLGYAIVRCSGLFDTERNPARFVTHMKQVSSSAPANMIHRLDAVGAVSFMALHSENHIVNATTPNTTSKAEFYQTALERASIDGQLPNIVDQPDKHISAEKLVSLGYRFHFNHVLDAL
ncbi:NAD(P)H-binding protein [Vibrio sonorensis]|uniref:NAD(P)H-binding protein n=1 Tax=Vibrio sonorensis TaxID=1004316 RepID=UPI0008D9B25A|nr:NAD(P)H-binding protein [Vibrio sonorensis]